MIGQTAPLSRRSAPWTQGLVPMALLAALRRQFVAGIGLALLIASALVLLALLSYNQQDPSWNTSGQIADHGPTNLLGHAGATTADLLIQLWGIAAFLVPLILTGWALRLVVHKRITAFGRRLSAALAALCLAGASAATLPASSLAWLPGLPAAGGGVGTVLLAGLAGVVGAAATGAVTGWVALAAAVVGFSVAVDLSPRAWATGMAKGAEGLVTAGRHATSLSMELGRVGATSAGQAARQAESWIARAASAAPNQRLDKTVVDADARAMPLRRTPHLEPRPVPTSATPQPPTASHAPSPMPAPTNRVHKSEPEPDGESVQPTATSVAPVPASLVTVGPQPRPLEQSRRAGTGPRQTSLDFGLGDDPTHELPPLELLQLPPQTTRATAGLNEAALQENAHHLEGVLGDFGVRGSITAVHPGPVVTLYELEPAPGTKSSRVIGLSDDIARSMSAVSVRVAVVPGRNVIGIELPNKKREIVYLRELLASTAYERSTAKLPLVLGKDIGGAPVIADLSRFPHLLVAGTTGSGKSVAINVMILSLVYRLPPDRCRLIMVDPKMLELSVYEGIPHLLAPVVTDPKVAVVALKWTVREMENRYRAMSRLGVRNIEGYNTRLREAREKGEYLTRRVQTGFDPDTGKPLFEEQPLDMTEFPYIVVVVDEMADLMLVAGKEIEAAIQRLAQMARAAGIHLIMATQRPSVDVITGTIKANFPTRISFMVTSKIDSRTILGEQGAEQLLGQGDMLYMAGGGRLTRVHGPFVRDDEVEAVVKFLKTQGEPSYVESITEEADEDDGDSDGGGGSAVGGSSSSGDALYDRAVALVCREGKASTSFIQRHLRIGYNSAARLMERMEKEGVVSKPNHVGKREVLAGSHDDVD